MEINVSAVILPSWYDVDDHFSLMRLLSELFPECAIEAVPPGSPAQYTKEFLRQVLQLDSSFPLLCSQLRRARVYINPLGLFIVH
jgi:hypothetical protein